MLSNRSRRILVMTVVHDPRDSRIWFRQINALLERGWHVTYAAPFPSDHAFDTGSLAPEAAERLRLIPLPKARGRARLRAALSARGVLRREGERHDVVLIHDPELLVAAVGRSVPHLVWDVHEDTAAALGQKAWLPGSLRRPTARIVRSMERWAEDRFTLILAEASYQDRFRKTHTFIPNAVTVPTEISPVGRERVVYLGSLTPARGSDDLPIIGRELRKRTHGAIKLEVIGPTYDETTTKLMLEADANQDLVWHGFLPADQALGRLRGALAGLSLLRDTPNFRHSMPTKILEYCAYGVPVITTPLPTAAKLVRSSGAGLVVPWNSPHAVVDAVINLSGDDGTAAEMGRRGHHVAAMQYDWAYWSSVFGDELEIVASRVSGRAL